MISKIKTAWILSFLAILTGALSYLSYPIIIPNLTEGAYAEFSVFMSLTTIAAIPLWAFLYSLIVLLRAHPQLFFSPKIPLKALKYGIYYIFFLIAFYVIAFYFLGLSSYNLLFLSILFGIPLLFTIWFQWFLTARELLLIIGCIWFLAAVLRTLFACLVFVFPNIDVAFLAFMLPSLLVSFLYFYFYKKHFFNKEPSENLDFSTLLSGKFFKKLFWNFLLASGVIILFQNIDIIFAKKLFPDDQVALYAAVGVIAKFVIVIIAVFESIALPTFADKKLSHLHFSYFKNLIILAILGFISSIIVFPLFGNFILGFLGKNFSASPELWIFSLIAMISLGFSSVFIKVLSGFQVSFYKIFFLPIIILCAIFLTHSLESFAFILAISFFILFLESIFLVHKNLSK